MHAHSPDRSLSTLFTGVPHSAGAAEGCTVSINVRKNSFGYLSFVIIDARGTIIGTITPAVDLKHPTLRHVGELLRTTIWAWRQGLRMANLELEVAAYNEAEGRLHLVEQYLIAEGLSETSRNLINEIRSLKSVNLKLVKVQS
jgi:hypothetical protein